MDSSGAHRKLRRLYLVGALDRFSYNGIRALLVLYLSRQLGLSDESSYTAYSIVMAIGFVTPVIGGHLSDRWLGHVHALRAGALLATFGSFLLLGPSLAWFYAGLSFLVLGSGLLKAVVPAHLGELAEDTPGQRDSMFSFLYLCFNVGTFFGTLACAVLGELYDWRLGFLIAGLGMSVCSLFCLLGLDRHPVARAAAAPVADPSLELAAVPAAPSTARTLGTLGALLIIHTFFFALYEQSGLSLNLFAERNVDRSLAGLLPELSGEIPVTAFQTIEPALNVLLGGFFVFGWRWLEKHRFNPGYFTKFAIGLLFVALAFWVLCVPRGGTLLSPWYLVLSYLLLVLGEQCVIPTGYAAVTALAPARHRSLFVGIWYCSFGASVWLAGLLSNLTAAAGRPGTGALESLRIYQQTFSSFAALAALLGFGLLIHPLTAGLRRRLPPALG